MKKLPIATGGVFRIVKALIVSFVATGILLLILTLILYKFKISNTQIYMGVIVIYLVSNLLGGLIIGKVTKEKKFLWGLLIGICYFVVLTVVSLIATRSFYDSGVNALIALASSAVGGMIGGMIS